jgi:YbbR domain-containing protein
VELVCNDFWRKLIALFFALLLYFYVYNEIRSTPQKIDNVPVDIVLPRELMDVDPKPHFVTLDIKSNRGASVSSSMLRGHATVEYSRYIPGKPYVLTLKPEFFTSPLGVKIVGADPGEITLNLQQRMSREVPVRVTFSSRLSNDYKSSLGSCIPSTVLVTGPEQLLRDLKSVSTRPIPLSENVTESFEYVATLDAPNGTTISPTKVTCQIDVVKNFEQRTFQSLPVQLLTQSGGKQFKTEFLSPTRVEVTVRGLAGSILALSAAEIRPYLDISHIDKPGIYEITVGCYVDGEGLDVKEIRPALLKMKITE